MTLRLINICCQELQKYLRHPEKYLCSDGRFQLGDELVNVNGSSLRGLSMEEARTLLRHCSGQVTRVMIMMMMMMIMIMIMMMIIMIPGGHHHRP